MTARVGVAAGVDVGAAVGAVVATGVDVATGVEVGLGAGAAQLMASSSARLDTSNPPATK